MDRRQLILEKYAEFNKFLEGISLEELKAQCTRQELNDFRDQLRDAKQRSLGYEISQMTEQMKREEFPQLMGVHRFPILNNIEFLTEEQKVKLDKFLVNYRVGNYVNGLWRITQDEHKRKQLLEWLSENGVVEIKYITVCPDCREGHISKLLSPEGKEELACLFSDYKQTGDLDVWEKLREILDVFCMECEEEKEIDNIEKLIFKDLHIMKMKRDTSLDHA